MSEQWTDEERKVARRLYDEIKDEIEKNYSDEAAIKALEKIVALSKDGLNEDEILRKIKDEQGGENMPRGIQGRLALARMERCM